MIIIVVPSLQKYVLPFVSLVVLKPLLSWVLMNCSRLLERSCWACISCANRVSRMPHFAAACAPCHDCLACLSLTGCGFCVPTFGRFVFSPRVVLCIDSIATVVYGSVFGCVNGCTRVFLGMLCGLLRTTILYEPVTPAACASLDAAYMSYGAAMRLAHVRLLDEEVGEGAAAGRPRSSSRIVIALG